MNKTDKEYFLFVTFKSVSITFLQFSFTRTKDVETASANSLNIFKRGVNKHIHANPQNPYEKIFVNNTVILKVFSFKSRLNIIEALLVKPYRSTFNPHLLWNRPIINVVYQELTVMRQFKYSGSFHRRNKHLEIQKYRPEIKDQIVACTDLVSHSATLGNLDIYSMLSPKNSIIRNEMLQNNPGHLLCRTQHKCPSEKRHQTMKTPVRRPRNYRQKEKVEMICTCHTSQQFFQCHPSR